MFGVLLVGGILGIALGVLMFCAGAMSDAPAEGNSTASQGAVLFLISIAAVIFALVGHHLGWLSL